MHGFTKQYGDVGIFILEDYGKKPNTFLFVKKYIFWEFPVSLCSMVGTQLKSLKLNKAANNKQLTPIF